MSVMFAAPSGGTRPTNGNLYEFKAGRAKLETGSSADKRKVVADKAKGTVYIKQTPDQLMHFGWKNRETGGSEDIDLIVFPGDTEFIRIKECSDARMFMLKFKNTSDDRRLFWLQENVKDKDEEIVKKVNDFLNNPPPQRTGARGGASERGNALLASLNGGDDIGALGNMDQNQLMQLFSLMQGGNGSEMLPLSLGGRGNEKDGGAIDEASGSSSDPLPSQIPVPSQSLGNPDLATPNMPGGKKQPRIKADQLRSIISSIATQPSDNKGNTPSSSSSTRGLRAPVELTDVINRTNVSDVVASNAERLIPHLPDQEPIKKDEGELKDTLNTPQFQKATSEFGYGLSTGQMAPVLEQFQLPQEAINAAQTGNVLEFAKKLTAAEAGTKEEIDAQINADADAQETNESSIKEPSAKKGKTDDDQMDLD
jgi:26S proteasome regulatory subunit N13